MSDGAKLASGYIELTVKAGDAMKGITAAITGLDKDAAKAGKAAGAAINKELSKAGADAGKVVGDELTKAATKAGEDAGEAIGKGVAKGAAAAGKSVGDELTKATKKAADDVVKTKIEPKVTPKVETKAAKDEVKGLGKSIIDGLRDSAEKAGYSMDQVWAEAGKRAGSVIGGALKDSPIGGFFRDIQGDMKPVLDGLDVFRDSLKNAGQNSPLGPVSDTLKDISTTLGSFNGSSKLEQTLANIGGKAGALGGVVSNLSSIVGLLGSPALNVDPNSQSSRLNSLGVIGGAAATGFQIAGPPGAAIGTALSGGMVMGNAIKGAFQNEHDTLNSGLPAAPGVPFDPSAAILAPPGSSAGPLPSLQDLLVPKRAAGGVAGVDGNGRLFGPGTGTSDSILGVGADGLPTAKVSRGEGVVKKQVMDRGGAAIVSALNNGDLPGYDDGTNNVGGPPIPAPVAPPIEVPQATQGQAGQFNSWISQQQGKAYQYGTLYDCSGFMSQVYNQMTGKQMPRFNTESDLAAYGFVRGSQAGTFQLGIHHGGGGPNSHMAGTLPDGRNVESGGSGVQIGAGAHGSSDPQFEDHWFLPGSGGMAGAPVDPASGAAAGGPGGIAQRTQGYIPAGAGGAGAAGSSLFSGILQNGAQAINGIIDQAASAASSAAGMAASAFAPGSGGAASGAAASAIGIGTGAAKRGVSYGFQMAGIGADALAEILLPFGVPRYFQTDPTAFMPHIGAQPAAVTTGEKAQTQGAQQAAGQTPNPALNPGGPVQAGQLPGAQPIAAPAPMAGATGIQSAPVPIGAPPGITPGAPAGPAVPQPVSPVAPPTPQSGPQAGQQPQQPKNVGDMLTQLTGMSKGGVVGVFDGGGWLPAGGIAINQSKRPEPILNDQQWSALNAAVAPPASGPDPSAMGGGHDYSMNFAEGSITVKDVAELEAQLSSRQRLQMMRFAGRP
jgi:hypothetical protein